MAIMIVKTNLLVEISLIFVPVHKIYFFSLVGQLQYLKYLAALKWCYNRRAKIQQVTFIVFVICLTISFVT